MGSGRVRSRPLCCLPRAGKERGIEHRGIKTKEKIHPKLTNTPFSSGHCNIERQMGKGKIWGPSKKE